MAYIPSECTRLQYDSVVYGIGPEHKLYIKVGNTELVEPDDFCESLVWRNQILSNGSKTFSLDNFVSKEIDLILRNYQIEDITSELEIKLGTYVEVVSKYVYIPLGKYLIQGNPTTDKGQTTYKLRDRSVLFDFNYNAKPLIEDSLNETEEGSKYVTKLEILQDICSKAGVNYVGSTTFIGYNDKIGIYDNTVSARVYVSDIAEQAGCIAYIDRNGDLDFILINNNLPTHQIPFDLVENYTLGNAYKVSKTIYESGKLYWDKGTDEHDNLFINGANPYIANQTEVDRVHDSVVGFEIQGFSIGRVVGNPAIDSFDIIEVYDDENDKTYRTLGQNTFTYNGIFRQSFETTIEQNAKQTNTTVNNEATFKKFVRSEIDNVNATVTTTIGLIDENSERINQVESTADGFTSEISRIDNLEITTSDLSQNVDSIDEQIDDLSLKTSELETENQNINDVLQYQEEKVLEIEATVDGVKISQSYSGGYNLLSNSVKQFGDEGWTGNFTNITNTDIQENSLTHSALNFMNGQEVRTISVPNGTYTFCAKYKKNVNLAVCKININGQDVILNEFDKWSEVVHTFVVNNGSINATFIGNTNNSLWLVDVLFVQSDIKQVYSPYPNEIDTGFIKASGSKLLIEATSANTKFEATTDGTRVRNRASGEVTSEFTDSGTVTKHIKADEGEISKILMIDMENIEQTWLSRM